MTAAQMSIFLFSECRLSLNAAGGDAFNVEFLHSEEEDCDRYGNANGAGKELLEVALHKLRRCHDLQTDSDGVVISYVTHDDLGENKVAPRTDEGGKNGINYDRLRHGQ